MKIYTFKNGKTFHFSPEELMKTVSSRGEGGENLIESQDTFADDAAFMAAHAEARAAWHAQQDEELAAVTKKAKARIDQAAKERALAKERFDAEQKVIQEKLAAEKVKA